MKRYLIMCLAAVLLCGITACKKSKSVNTETKTGEEQAPEPNTAYKSLNYLYKISGKKTLAGIHNREPNAQPAKWTEEIKNTTDLYPALWSGDFLFQQDNIDNRQMMVNEALNQWRLGAVVNIMWHACNPANSQPCSWDDGKGVMSSLSDTQWAELITDGTVINTRWKQMMDEVSVHLSFLRDNGVEVLWRPLHEMNQAKFWWGGRPGANGTARLWQLTYNYMRNTKGLTNLIWVWDMQDFSSLTADLKNYNPGKEYWDVAALDVYEGNGFTTVKYQAMLGISGGKPIALGECSKLPTAQQLLEQPKWTFFMGWSELVFSNNSSEQIRTLHQAANVLTLNEMPGW
jgi:mannan endo-1,4-beta-mannosidase